MIWESWPNQTVTNHMAWPKSTVVGSDVHIHFARNTLKFLAILPWQIHGHTFWKMRAYNEYTSISDSWKVQREGFSNCMDISIDRRDATLNLPAVSSWESLPWSSSARRKGGFIQCPHNRSHSSGLQTQQHTICTSRGKEHNLTLRHWRLCECEYLREEDETTSKQNKSQNCTHCMLQFKFSAHWSIVWPSFLKKKCWRVLKSTITTCFEGGKEIF